MDIKVLILSGPGHVYFPLFKIMRLLVYSSNYSTAVFELSFSSF